MIPPSVYDFLNVYWPHILLVCIGGFFAAMVYTATKWAIARRR